MNSIIKKIQYLKNNKLKIKLIIYLIIPILILFIPVKGIEERPLPCLSRIILKKECIGCGITRACINALHFNFKNAVAYNKLVIIVLPLCMYIYLYTIYKIYRQIRKG